MTSGSLEENLTVLDELEVLLTQNRNAHLSTNLGNEHALILSGIALSVMTETKEISEKFINVIDKMKVVVACRVSPKQKSDIVQMVRKKHPNKTTLSIGDGANDVNMITAANVGIGITGLEG